MSLDAATDRGARTSGNNGAPEVSETDDAHVELETPTRRGDVLAASLFFAGGLVGYFLVVPAAVYVPSKFAGTVNSPAFLPEVLFILLAALGAVYLVRSLVAHRRERIEGRVRAVDWALAGGTALICIGYILAIYLVGLTLASALCVAVTIVYFGERRAWIVGTIAIVLPAVLWYFFATIAHILFPTPVFGLMNWLESALPSGSIARLAQALSPVSGLG